MEREGFPGCVGFIDWTTIPLAQKPAVDGECYFDRKHRYSVNAQVVCDDRRRIISFYSGLPGSCSDSAVYHEMRLAADTDKRLFFYHNPYLVADFAWLSLHELRVRIRKREDMNRICCGLRPALFFTTWRYYLVMVGLATKTALTLTVIQTKLTLTVTMKTRIHFVSTSKRKQSLVGVLAVEFCARTTSLLDESI
ncbi:hypothetical protein PHMEG_0004186 [Phytophthora megakarya]|uniref:DDE Tnp4 domain-containing protein n=1 Tax=Phytophthora megakarya TaxID=4795 RepID=A0A225WUF7_9STRA|nr:hypothetical protein PHMEG_0004186 [Phytophthora megakarya]